MNNTAVLRFLPQGFSHQGKRIAEPYTQEQAKTYAMEDDMARFHAAMGDFAPIYLAGCATSSLDVAHALIAQGTLPPWGSVLALQQTAGRGQMRREWISPSGNIYAALRLPMAGPFLAEAAAPALGGLVATALDELGFEVGLKWPNDILQLTKDAPALVENFRGDLRNQEHCCENAPQRACLCNNEQLNNDEALFANHGGIALEKDKSAPTHTWKKTGGILLEERAGALVAGIGLNLIKSPDSSALRPGFAFPAGTLQQTKLAVNIPINSAKNVFFEATEKAFFVKPPAPLFLWGQLVKKIFSCYTLHSLESMQHGWLSITQKYLAFTGQKVRLDDAVSVHNTNGRKPDAFMTERTVEGIMEGLCPSGALRLRTSFGSQTFLGGSLTPLS